MSLFADALQSVAVPGLSSVVGRPTALTVSGLIGGEGKFGFDLDFDDLNKAIITDFRENSLILRALSSDASRFASAAFQTVRRIKSDIVEKDRTAWSIIQIYYAAFYAGHSIIRMLGESCSYLDGVQISRIERLGQAIGKIPNFKLSANTYHCVLDQSSNVFRSISLREGPGGSHGIFWNTFSQKLNKVGEQILLGPLVDSDKQQIFAKIEEFRRNLSAQNAPQFSHLSAVRNEVQYKHTRDVWIPSNMKKEKREYLSRISEIWTSDPLSIDISVGLSGSIERFISTCVFVIAVALDLLRSIAQRSPKPSNSFARLGPLAFI